MDFETLKRLYTINLQTAYQALKRVVTDPLTLDNKLYDAEDEDEGKAEIKKRIKVNGKDIVEFLGLHEEALNHFENIGKNGNPPNQNYTEMFTATTRLLDILEKYERLVSTHKQRESVDDYLEYPSDRELFNESGTSIGLMNSIAALRFASRELSRFNLKGFKLGKVAPGDIPYEPIGGKDKLLSWMDNSYKCQFEYTKKELKEKFKLKV